MLGITPACAGTTVVMYECSPCPRDHPRMCGDHAKTLFCSLAWAGSPPHVRGPQHLSWRKTWYRGITPACAGTTHSVVLGYLGNGDHPRMCGDHIDQLKDYSVCVGSPPHVRGPLRPMLTVFPPLGITPACAGTTIRFGRSVSLMWDHPRMCGDHPTS